MTYILKFAASFLVLFSACTFSEPKDYQKVWMDEPLSLHDMMIIKANNELDDYLSKVTKDQVIIFPSYRFAPDERWEWMQKPKEWNLDFVSSLTVIDSSVKYDLKQGKYIISTTSIWDFSPEWLLRDADVSFDQGLLANTQKNIANACELIVRMSSAVYLSIPEHEGYSYKKLDNNKPAAINGLLEDTNYTAKIFVNKRNDKTHLICTQEGTSPYIKHKFHGDWHKLDKYQTIIRGLDKRNKMHTENKHE